MPMWAMRSSCFTWTISRCHNFRVITPHGIHRLDPPVADRRGERSLRRLKVLGLGEGAHEPNPSALKGHGCAQRETFAQGHIAFDAGQARVARKIGRGGDVDLLGPQPATFPFGGGNDCIEALSA